MKDNSRQKSYRQKANAIRENYGRPTDDHLQSFFMKKLREGKLQMINAESQAEYVCGQCNQSTESKDLSKEKTLKVAEIFKKKLGPDYYGMLWRVFLEGTQKWEYKEIQSEFDFPKYLFLDELDLSYILYQFLNSSIPQLESRTEITTSQLLLFCLLSFSCRDMISLRVLEAIEASYESIIKSMQGLKQRIVSEFNKRPQGTRDLQTIEGEQEIYSEASESEEDKIRSELRRGQKYKDIRDIEELQKGEETHKLHKTKLIEKGEKKEEKKGDKKRPRGRPKNKQSLDQQHQPVDHETLKKILQKLVNYIAWAYKYIYPQEVAKRERLKSQN